MSIHRITGTIHSLQTRVKEEIIVLAKGGIAVPIVTYYQDYREIYGERIPFKIISSNEQSGRIIVQYETTETNIQLDDTFFVLAPREE